MHVLYRSSYKSELGLFGRWKQDTNPWKQDTNPRTFSTIVITVTSLALQDHTDCWRNDDSVVPSRGDSTCCAPYQLFTVDGSSDSAFHKYLHDSTDIPNEEKFRYPTLESIVL
jgi:hypothetical protein